MSEKEQLRLLVNRAFTVFTKLDEWEALCAQARIDTPCGVSGFSQELWQWIQERELELAHH